MNKHDLIRILAIILAVFLIVGIFNLIFRGIKFALFFFKDERVLNLEEKDYTIIRKIEENEKKVNDINKLNEILKFTITDKTKVNINLTVTQLDLKTGNEFILKSDNPYLEIIEESDLLKIVDNTKGKFTNKKDLYKLEIQIPNKIYDELKIETGVSKVEIEDIIVKELVLNLGVGEADLENIKVLEKADIRMGVGNCNIGGILNNKIKIKGGVGKLEIDLKDNIKNYTFEIEQGLGKVKINDQIIKRDDRKIGSGSNIIEIEGGIGEILIETED